MPETGPELIAQELTSWKAIAERLGVTVRTAQLWEEKRALPVRRHPGPRGRVSIALSELESWKQATTTDALPVPPPGPGAFPVRLDRWRATIWASVGLVLVALSVAAIRGLVLPTHPASFRIERDTLVILDDRGRELWRKSFPGLEPSGFPADSRLSAWFGDLDGDGNTEVLFVPLHDGFAGPLVCYSSSGQERWRFLPHPVLRTRREEFRPPFHTEWFTVAPVGPRGSRRVIVGSRHHTYYPMQIALLAPDGRLLREYWHSGYFGNLLLQDLDGDGRPEIILGGISNGSKAATLVVLDPDEFAGASVEENPDYQLLGFPPGVERARLLFPRSCINKALEEPFNFVHELFTEQSGLAVAVAERSAGEQPVVYYHLTRQLELRQIGTSTTFVRVHAQLHATGQLDHAYSPKEPDSLKIQYLVNRAAAPGHAFGSR